MAKRKDPAPQSELEALSSEADTPSELQASDPAPQSELEASAPPTSTAVTVEKRYRVWPHGSLVADGQTFAPGEDVPYGLRGLTCVEEY